MDVAPRGRRRRLRPRRFFFRASEKLRAAERTRVAFDVSFELHKKKKKKKKEEERDAFRERLRRLLCGEFLSTSPQGKEASSPHVRLGAGSDWRRGSSSSEEKEEEEEEEEEGVAVGCHVPLNGDGLSETTSLSQMTMSLAALAADSATRFCETMRRLWSAYFVHMHSEVRVVLQTLDDTFAAFEANPCEDTLADFFESHQRLRPFLVHLLGMRERQERGETNEATRSRQDDSDVCGDDGGGGRCLAGATATVLPPGNPLEQEEALVRQLSLSIAETVSPLLAIAMRRGRVDGLTRPQSGKRHGGTQQHPQEHSQGREASCGRYSARTQSLSAGGESPAGSVPSCHDHCGSSFSEADEAQTPDGQTSPMSFHGHTHGVHWAENTNGGDCCETRAPRASLSTPAAACGRPTTSSADANCDFCSRGRAGPSSRAVRDGAFTARSEPRRQRRDDCAPMGALFCGQAGRLPRDKQRHASLSPCGRSSLLDGPDVFTNFSPTAGDVCRPLLRNESSFADRTDGAALDPFVRLRQLRQREEKDVFLLMEMISRREGGGSDATCYAMHKRLARLRSEILRTEREVNELRRIGEAKRALRREREIREHRRRCR